MLVLVDMHPLAKQDILIHLKPRDRRIARYEIIHKRECFQRVDAG